MIAESKFIGRESYIALLNKKLNDAMEGRGNAIVIFGDTGTGKTRLIKEFIKTIDNKALVMQSACASSTSVPYAPLRNALKGTGMDMLFEYSKNPKLEAIFAVTKSGILLSKMESQHRIDSDILVGMVNAVTAFVKDTLCQMQESENMSEDVHSMRYGTFNLLSVPGETINLIAVLTGRENELLISDMQEVIRRIEREHRDALQNWDGNLNKMAGLSRYLSVLFSEGQYSGVSYAQNIHIEKLNLYENVLYGFRRKTEQSPLILVIDDIQYADPATFDLLVFLMRSISDMRAFIICACNEKTGNGAQYMEMLGTLAKDEIIKTITLNDLSEAETIALVNSILGNAGDEELPQQIYQVTRGNPLFTIETLSALLEEGKIKLKGDYYEYEFDKIRLPIKIYEILEAKIRKLDLDALHVLQCASIEGNEFHAGYVARLLDTTKLKVLRVLSTLESTGLVIRVEGEKYRFVQPLMREVIHTSIDEALRNEYHRYFGEILETEYLAGKHDSMLPMIENYITAGDVEKIKKYALVAGRFALSCFANERAADILMRSYARLSEMHGSERIEFLRTLVDALDSDGKYTEEIAYIDEILKFVRCDEKLTDKKNIEVWAYGKRAECNIARSNYSEAMGDVKNAISILFDGTKNRGKLPTGLETTYGKLLCIEGLVYERLAEHKQAINYYMDAIKQLENSNAHQEIAYAYHRIGTAYHSLGMIEDAEKFLHKSLEISRKNNDLKGISITSNNLGELYRGLGEKEKAIKYYEEALAIDKKLGDRRGLSVVYSSLGDIALDYEEYAHAIEYYEQSNKICRRIDNKYGIAWNLCGIAECRVRMKEHTDVIQNLTKSFEIASRIGARDVMGWAHRVNALYEELSENLERARNLYEKSASIFENAGMEIERAKTLMELGRMYLQRGIHRDNGISLLNSCLELFSKKHAKNYLRKCQQYMGDR